jgi:NAD(P)H-hydrate epimerase
MKIVTAEQMRKIDDAAINTLHIPGLLLMENAGIQVANCVMELIPKLTELRVGVFVGKGNNGGDGLVVARQLHSRGIPVTVFLLAEESEYKGDAKINLEALKHLKVKILTTPDEVSLRRNKIRIDHLSLMVDAVLGTGSKPPVEGVYKQAVEMMNNARGFRVAVDIPTGLNADSGEIVGNHLEADMTVTFGLPKLGLLSYPAADFVGDLRIVNIGFPPELLESAEAVGELIELNMVRDALPVRRKDAHKGTFGHAVIVGGSLGKGGAVALASSAALRIGAGLVTAAIPYEINSAFETGVPEVMTFPVAIFPNGQSPGAKVEDLVEFLKDKDAVCVGPGLTTQKDAVTFLHRVLTDLDLPLVLDADGINGIAGNEEALKKVKSTVVMTPHPGELSRLLNVSVPEIQKDRVQSALNAARRFNAVVVLKGAHTVIAAPEGKVYMNPTGNVGLASGGTGDVLSGMIAGLIAQGVKPLEAALCGVYLHGLAADLYVEENNPETLTASELIRFMPRSIRKITQPEKHPAP